MTNNDRKNLTTFVISFILAGSMFTLGYLTCHYVEAIQRKEIEITESRARSDTAREEIMNDIENRREYSHPALDW